jgi:hypothetical protein
MVSYLFFKTAASNKKNNNVLNVISVGSDSYFFDDRLIWHQWNFYYFRVRVSLPEELPSHWSCKAATYAQ